MLNGFCNYLCVLNKTIKKSFIGHRFGRNQIQFDKSPGPRNTEYCENEELPVETKERGVEEGNRRGQRLDEFKDSKC